VQHLPHYDAVSLVDLDLDSDDDSDEALVDYPQPGEEKKQSECSVAAPFVAPAAAPD